MPTNGSQRQARVAHGTPTQRRFANATQPVIFNLAFSAKQVAMLERVAEFKSYGLLATGQAKVVAQLHGRGLIVHKRDGRTVLSEIGHHAMYLCVLAGASDWRYAGFLRLRPRRPRLPQPQNP